MLLTSTNIVQYLLERGLVSAQQIVDGDYMVVEAPRRNRNFKIMNRQRHGLFLKQVARWDEPSLATLRVEAHCYRLTNEHQDFAALRNLVPKFHGYDERRAVLVTELLAGGESLAEYYHRHHAFPLAVATQLGQAFGQYHCLVRTFQSDAAVPIFPKRVPWVLSFHTMSPEYLQNVSTGNYQLLEILKRYPDFGRILDKLASEWKFESLIHGDIKWDNCVLVPTSPQAVTLKLVDWELADWGDPSWDVAAIFSAFIVFWIQSIPLTPGTPIETAMTQAQFPIEQMQPAIDAFWKAYCETMQLDSVTARDVLRRAVLYCGARTVQTAYEYVQSSPQLSQLSFLILQASLNILTKPEEATQELLGLTIQ